MRFPKNIPVYGDKSYRGDCPSEETEQINFFSWLRCEYPELAKIAIHPRNESKRTWGQVNRQKKDGSINKGASDIVIPAAPSFICELKRLNHRDSQWQEGQKEYLETAIKLGAFGCVALGAEAAKEALQEWLLKNDIL